VNIKYFPKKEILKFVAIFVHLIKVDMKSNLHNKCVWLHKLLRLVLQVGHQTPFFKSGHNF